MRKYMSISDPSHDRLIDFINKYYTSSGWRIISIGEPLPLKIIS